MQATKSVPGIERAFAMLEVLDKSTQGMNIADLSRRLSIPRSTAHTIALTLERCGYLTRDSSQRHCKLSAKAYLLGRESMQTERLASAAYTPMRRLSLKTLLTSHLATLDQNQATYIQKVQGPGVLHMDTYVGKRTNLHCTAVGKVLLSYAPEPYRNKVLARAVYARYTQNTITVASALRQELQRVSTEAYALDDQEEELDIRCLAVPVFSHRGEFLAALSISGTTNQLHNDRLPTIVASLKQTSRFVANELHSGESADAI